MDRGVITIALDPREAAFCLNRGWATLDDIVYRVSLKGWTGALEGDGRVTVRCEIDVHECLTHREGLLRLGA